MVRSSYNTLPPAHSSQMLCDSSSPEVPHLIHLSSQLTEDDKMKEGLTDEQEITILGFGEGDVDVQNAMRNKTEAANAALWPL